MTLAPIKICGLTTSAAAECCVQAGVAAVGVVFYPKSPRNVSADQAAQILAVVPPHVARVGVFVDMPPEEILRIARIASLTTAQLHGSEDSSCASSLLDGGLGVVKVLRGGVAVEPKLARAAASAYPVGVRFMLECGKGALPGGNGSAWNWRATREVARECSLPLAIAGGLCAENLAMAAEQSGAVFFDISSGAESAPGVKDPTKIAELAAVARSLKGCDYSFMRGQ